MATASSAGAKAIGFACSPGEAMTTPIGCHGSWTPLLGSRRPRLRLTAKALPAALMA